MLAAKRVVIVLALVMVVVVVVIVVVLVVCVLIVVLISVALAGNILFLIELASISDSKFPLEFALLPRCNQH